MKGYKGEIGCTLWALFLVFLFFLPSCGKKDAIKIGFVGGLTGRVADLGTAGRDGVILAVEEQNRAGGINGKQIILSVKDDKQDPEQAGRANRQLIDEGVAAIIGHMTSAMSKVGASIADEGKVLMISPTTSTDELSGRDDYFFRVYPASVKAAEKLAEHIYAAKGISKVSVLYDIKNRAHTESLYLHFKETFEAIGGQVAGAHSYFSSSDVGFFALTEKLVADQPQALLLLANAMDTAMLCQQLKKLNQSLPIFTSEWSATEEVLELGGRCVEGMTFLHTFDKRNSSPDYLRFRDRFFKRFHREPGFASTHAYDAAGIVFEALKVDEQPAHLRDTIIEIGSFRGLQGEIRFDTYGDVSRDYFLMVVKDGRFEVVPEGG